MATPLEQPLLTPPSIGIPTPPPSPTAGQYQPYPQQYQQPYPPQYPPQYPQLPPQPSYIDSEGGVQFEEPRKRMEIGPIVGLIAVVLVLTAYVLWYFFQQKTFYKWSPTVSISIAFLAYIAGLVSKDINTSMFITSLFFILCSLIVYIMSIIPNIKKVTMQDWISLGVSFILCIFSYFIGRDIDLYGTVGLVLPSFCVFLLMFGVMYNAPERSD